MRRVALLTIAGLLLPALALAAGTERKMNVQDLDRKNTEHRALIDLAMQRVKVAVGTTKGFRPSQAFGSVQVLTSLTGVVARQGEVQASITIPRFINVAQAGQKRHMVRKGDRKVLVAVQETARLRAQAPKLAKTIAKSVAAGVELMLPGNYRAGDVTGTVLESSQNKLQVQAQAPQLVGQNPLGGLAVILSANVTDIKDMPLTAPRP